MTKSRGIPVGRPAVWLSGVALMLGALSTPGAAATETSASGAESSGVETVWTAASPARPWRVVLDDSVGDVWRADLRSDEWISAGDVPQVDVRRADLRHGPRRVNVRTWFVDLQRVGRGVLWVGVETRDEILFARLSLRGGDRGGTLRLVEEPGGPALTCRGLRHSVDYRVDRISISVPRRCLGGPRRVRVNVTAQGWLTTVPYRGLLSDTAHSDRPSHPRGSRWLRVRRGGAFSPVTAADRSSPTRGYGVQGPI